MSQKTYDICEHVICNIDTFVQQYVEFGSNLTFHDYCLTKTAVALQDKFNRYDITEAFEHPKLIAVLDFYSKDEDEDSQIIVH